jgi:hypothetical protein
MRAFLLSGAAMLLTISSPIFASATLESGSNRAIQHKESGWVFPQKVGKLERVKAATVIAGTDDVLARYKTGKGENAIYISVYVYPTKSAVLDSTYEGAKSAIIERSKNPFPMARLWSEGPFTVGTQRKFMGRKSIFQSGLYPNSVVDNLYHYDTGQWTVKIRVTGREEIEANMIGDEFVKSLPWESLNIVEGQCTGYACSINRPVAIYGLIHETRAGMFADVEGIKVDESGPECLTSDIVARLSAAPKLNATGLGSLTEKVANCRIGDRHAGFVRFFLPPASVETPVLRDGLTLVGPFTFAMVKKGNDIELAELFDGVMDAPTMEAVLKRIQANNHAIFRIVDSTSGRSRPVVRF